MNYLKTGILLTVLTLFFVWIGSFFGGARGAAIAFTVALLMNGISYFYSDKIIIAMYGARPADPGSSRELYEIVSELAKAARLPMPKIYIMNNPSPNAFATGRNPSHACVCVTTGILGMLNRDELRGVIAHELAHVKNRDTLIMTVTASIAGAIMMIANMVRWTAMFGGLSRNDRDSGNNLIGLIAVAIVAPIAAMIIQLAISRSREYGADAGGGMISHDPHALASALAKLDAFSKRVPMPATPQTAHLFIVSPFSGNFIANLFATHPPISDRIARLNRMKVK